MRFRGFDSSTVKVTGLPRTISRRNHRFPLRSAECNPNFGYTQKKKKKKKNINSPHTLLRPFKVAFCLFCSFDTVIKVGPNTFQAALCKSLQFHKFSLFCIQFSGSVLNKLASNFFSCYLQNKITYVCACIARPLSNGAGSNTFCMRSLKTSTTSTPEYDSELLESQSPLKLPEAILKPEARLPPAVLPSETSGGEPDTREMG